MQNFNRTIILEDGIEVQQTKSYGIGIDCHSRFIAVSVLIRRDMKFYEYRNDFSTVWDSLVRAKSWALQVIQTCSDPVPDLSSIPFHYCIESTSTYHMPILLAWEGTPSIVNPTLAGAAKRKTDHLDAKLLALHDLTGVWRESYLPSVDVNELRVLISERNRFLQEATSAGNRINNIIVRFGLTAGREGSIVRNSSIRSLIEDQISDFPSSFPDICPIRLPSEVRTIVRDEYDKFDFCTMRAAELLARIRNRALSMDWETDTGVLPGTDMIRLLASAPQIGDVTAITWLAHIITPRRFPNSKALAAYCGLDPSLKISAGKVTSTKKRGGCKELHKALTSSADRVIRNHTELFGRWGYNLYQQTGKWKKSANAVGRKLATALYFMMKTGTEFSYDSYHLLDSISTFDIPVPELPSLNPDFRRYVRILQENGIHSTSRMASAYLACELGPMKGLGRKFFMTVKDFLDNHHKYEKLYHELQSQKGDIQHEQ